MTPRGDGDAECYGARGLRTMRQWLAFGIVAAICVVSQPSPVLVSDPDPIR